MTALWKRRAQRAEERQALDELEHYGIDPRIARYWAERTDTTPINPPRPERDPRGRVTVICGRCGQPALSEKTPTILEHYTEAHGKAPRQLVLGRFEERCEVTE